ncbi:MAG: NERD domain-containing protein [Syntrophomonadaceae bacterium]
MENDYFKGERYMSIYIFILLIVLALILSLPSVKGKIGEGSVRLLLSRLDKEKYFILNDLYLPNDKGKTSQIDHVVVSPYGIFVIETKNYRGWILGDENSQYWTQVIYKRKEKLLNPIIQNKGHIKALKAILSDFGEVPFISIVTFSSRATLKVQVDSTVIYTPQIIRTIEKYEEEVIPLEDVKKIYETIKNANIQDKEVSQTHKAAIQNDIKDKKLKVQNNECPWCGGELVDRQGKFGAFRGCSNYPKCRFTVK